MNVIMYGQPNCASCSAVKSMLKAKAIDYEYIDITNPNGYDAYKSDFPGARVVPTMVIVDQEGISSALKIIGGNPIVKYLSVLE